MVKRKGITPVIAIVLLLLITVGAVGVVYSQFRSLTGNPSQKLASQQKTQNTKLVFDSVYKDTGCGAACDGSINISLRNTGSVGVNVSKQFKLQVIPDGSSSPVDFETYNRTRGNTVGSKSCFVVGKGKTLDPGETYTCDTALSFPTAGSSLGLRVTFKTAQKYWQYSCSPSTSSSLSC